MLLAAPLFRAAPLVVLVVDDDDDDENVPPLVAVLLRHRDLQQASRGVYIANDVDQGFCPSGLPCDWTLDNRNQHFSAMSQ